MWGCLGSEFVTVDYKELRIYWCSFVSFCLLIDFSDKVGRTRKSGYDVSQSEYEIVSMKN